MTLSLGESLSGFAQILGLRYEIESEPSLSLIAFLSVGGETDVRLLSLSRQLGFEVFIAFGSDRAGFSFGAEHDVSLCRCFAYGDELAADF